MQITGIEAGRPEQMMGCYDLMKIEISIGGKKGTIIPPDNLQSIRAFYELR